MKNEQNNTLVDYQGNGWSKYQIYVLKQLDEHNQIFKLFVEKTHGLQHEIYEIRKELESNKQILEHIKRKFADIENSNVRIDRKIEEFEVDKKVNEGIKVRFKIFWSALGGAIALISTFLFHILEQFISNFLFKK